MKPSDLSRFSGDGLSVLRKVLARAACAARGHDWCVATPPPESGVAAVLRPFTLCARCGQLDVGQVKR